MITNEKIIKDNTKTMITNKFNKAGNEINPNDVLCGRGGLTNSHIGNKRFRYIVAEYQQEYLHSRKNEKKTIARKIVARTKENGGRFLQRSANSSVWSEVTQKKALEKTSQALREGLDVRHKTVRPAKLVHRRGNNSVWGGESIQKQAKVVAGFVMESPKINETPTREDIPDLVPDESPIHRFEPLFTFSSPITTDHVEYIPETQVNHVQQI